MTIRDIVKKYENLLREDKYEEVFKNCDDEEKSMLVNFLYNCGINVLTYMTTIPTQFFYGTNIKIVTIPNNITSIGYQAFALSNVSEVYMDDSVTSMDAAVFLNCHNLSKIRLSRSLEKIPNRTFENCSSLQRIFIPESVTVFGNDVFRGCPDDILIVTTFREDPKDNIRFTNKDVEFYKTHLKFKRQ